MNIGRIKAGTLKRIHVNRLILRNNLKTGKRTRPLSIQTSKGVKRAGHVFINGPSQLVYGDTALSCGARVWIQTEAEVEYV